MSLVSGAVALFATARKLALLAYRSLRYGHDYVDIGQAEYGHQPELGRLAGLQHAASALGNELVPVRPPGQKVAPK